MMRHLVIFVAATLLVSCSPVSVPLPADMSTFDAAIAKQIDSAARALRRDPHDARRWRRLGMLYHAHDQFDLAVQCYEQSRELLPDDAQTHFYLALAERRLGHMPAAIAAMRIAADLDPDYAAARWRLGLLLLEDGDLAAARSEADRAFAMTDGDRAATLVLARVHLVGDDPQAAAALLESHLASRPDDRYAHNLLGRAYRRLDRADDALLHVAQGQAAEPGWSDPWSDQLERRRAGFPAALAAATQRLGSDPEGAVAEFERLRRDRPDNGTVLINLGIGYRMIGRLEESAAALRDALAREPARGLAHFHLAVTYAGLSQASAGPEPFAMALEHAARAVELQPTSARTHALQGELLAQANQPAAAIEAYRKAVRDPQDASWLHRLGALLCQVQRWQEAIPVLEDFLRRTPQDTDARFLLGVAQANAGQLDDAAANLERVRQLRPGDPRIQQALVQLERARAAAPEK